jgi:hypothetical protein
VPAGRQAAALGCMEAFGTTDFRDNVANVTVPTLVVHGDADGTVPFESSGKRTHEAISGSLRQRHCRRPAPLQRQSRRRVQPRPAGFLADLSSFRRRARRMRPVHPVNAIATIRTATPATMSST